MIPDFSTGRLLVAGDVMLDRYWYGPTSRISPEAPVPVVRIARDEARPGGAANVALNIAALGAQARLLGVVGRDDAAEQLRRVLTGDGIALDFQIATNGPTITKLRVLSRNQQLIRLDFEEPLLHEGAFDRVDYLQRFRRALDQAQVVVLSDYGKGTLVDTADLVAAAREKRCPVLIDPKGNDWRAYRGATLVSPNMSELEAVVGPCPDEASIVAKGTRLCEELALQALLITRSEHGMSLLMPGETPLHLPTDAREVFDVTGAGDTVIATFATCLAAGESFAQAAHTANLAAGIAVGKLGAATVSPAELRHVMRHQHQQDAGIMSQDDLVHAVAAVRAQGQTVVMTNGCFDLLHVGHVRYLEAARKLGDVLIVAVNDDASVRRLKGDSRPLNPVADRMQMLSALECVDWVVSFSEDTPARLIGAVLPDILVKGGDYSPEQIAGYDAVTAHGGQVRVLDFHPGYSTSRLIERARG